MSPRSVSVLNGVLHRLFPDLPIMTLEGLIVVTRTKPYKPAETFDDGEWLRPLFVSQQEKTQLVPDSETVARIRAQLLHLIEEESIPLVA